MHRYSFGHRDIKTENILIDNKFNLKICDFGFACKMTDEHDGIKIFDSNELVGSPEYNPPEITNIEKYGNYKAD